MTADNRQPGQAGEAVKDFHKEGVDTNTPVKLTVLIPGENYQQLVEMADSMGATRTEALKQLIVDRFWLQERINEGSEVLLRDPQGEISIVTFQTPGSEPSPDGKAR